jgi:4-alpha-glucanotransferase
MRLQRSAGILLHPTSLPGPHGSGDLGPSAYHFIDWLVAAGQKLWQILPLGGIGPGNSPYMSSSAFAGNVLLVDLEALYKRGWLTAADMAPLPAFEDERIDFTAVIPWRMERLWRAAQAFWQHGTAGERNAFERFCATHASWLDDYALFMALVDAHGGTIWTDWPPALAQRDSVALRDAAARFKPQVDFWRFCQWCFFDQWLQLKAYANRHGVQIVGDAPIFIAAQSAEVWARQELFELDVDGRCSVIAGVPPDFFSATGQRWGNPLYRWSAHAADGYAWWIERVRHTFAMVDIVRIDHFRGFAAYWEIPADEPTAIHGRWVPGPGAALFDAIAAALGPLPVIAEDLGVITPDVDALRRQFDFPGMRILHFAFGDKPQNPYLPHNYEPDTVVYPGTHDNNTTIGWWTEATPKERAHVCEYLGLTPADAEPEIHWIMIRTASASVADLCIVAMQDVLGLGGKDRMNLPGEMHGNWSWRFHWEQVKPEHADRLARLSTLYLR